MKMSALFAILALSSVAHAKKLSEYRPYSFEVLFTNPTCAEHRYPTPVTANDGTTLVAKPKNVYCKKSDAAVATRSPMSPEFRLIEWISAATTKELFVAYLSFSNDNVGNALCEAARRGVKIDIVLDMNPEEEARGETNRLAESIKRCGDKVRVMYRGQRGGIGYAHNKLLMVNPDDAKKVQIVYSSGNLSTGPSINHENWNFVTTSPESYFAQVHRCLRTGLADHAAVKKDFVDFMAGCRRAIGKSEESDIRSFFVPGEGRLALDTIRTTALRASALDTTAHRFSGAFIRLFTELLGTGKTTLRLITDDDMYWSWKSRQPVGMNMVNEAFKVRELKEKGVQMRYIETNHAERLLQHNKYMIFDVADADAVFHGAGNFTSDAFDKNFENFYFVTIPEVVAAYKAQYAKFWGEMGTPEERLPSKNITP